MITEHHELKISELAILWSPQLRLAGIPRFDRRIRTRSWIAASRGDALISDYRQRLREYLLAAPVLQAPAPWQPVLDNRTPIGGLLGIGFAVHPGSRRDLVMVVSHDGHGLFDAVTGEKVARDRLWPGVTSRRNPAPVW